MYTFNDKVDDDVERTSEAETFVSVKEDALSTASDLKEDALSTASDVKEDALSTASESEMEKKPDEVSSFNLIRQ